MHKALHALLAALIGLANLNQTAFAETKKLASGEWLVHAPMKGLKDLPNLANENDGGEIPGAMWFVCDRARYYLMVTLPGETFAKSEPGAIVLGDAPDARHATTFKDLYGTRAPLGKKFDRDADIMFAEVPKAMLAKLTDGGTLGVTMKGQTWSMTLNGIAAKVPTFTAFCETGKRLNPAHFGK